MSSIRKFTRQTATAAREHQTQEISKHKYSLPSYIKGIGYTKGYFEGREEFKVEEEEF